MNDPLPIHPVPESAVAAPDDAAAQAEELRKAAEARFAELREIAGQAMAEARVRWKDVGDQAAQYVKENPGKAVLAGLGVGYLLGLITRR